MLEFLLLLLLRPPGAPHPAEGGTYPDRTKAGLVFSAPTYLGYGLRAGGPIKKPTGAQGFWGYWKG